MPSPRFANIVNVKARQALKALLEAKDLVVKVKKDPCAHEGPRAYAALMARAQVALEYLLDATDNANEQLSGAWVSVKEQPRGAPIVVEIHSSDWAGVPSNRNFICLWPGEALDLAHRIKSEAIRVQAEREYE